jgi:tetratricopeptide (TPR) repeat protein
LKLFPLTACSSALLAVSLTLVADSLEQSLHEGRYPAALHFADAALKTRPGDLRLMTARALALSGMKRTRESLETFDTVLHKRPDFVPALRGAAQTSYTARDQRAALYLERLIKLDSTDATAHSMAGVLSFEGGDCPSAARHFEAGRAETEGNPQAFAMFGVCLMTLGRAPEAVTVFERLRRAEPLSTAILRSLASTQASVGNLELAASTLNCALELKPEEQTYLDLAALCIVNYAPERALSAIQSGLEKLPRSARLHSMRGVVEAERGLQTEAEKDFEISNQLDPKQQYGSPGLGVLYADTGRAAEASAILRSRVGANPSDATLNYLLAQALMGEGAAPGSVEFREAEAALIRATRREPGYAAAHTALGKLYRKSGEDASAIAELQIAVKLDGTDRAALNQLAGLLKRAGRIEEANGVIARLRQLVIAKAATAPSQ